MYQNNLSKMNIYKMCKGSAISRIVTGIVLIFLGIISFFVPGFSLSYAFIPILFLGMGFGSILPLFYQFITTFHGITIKGFFKYKFIPWEDIKSVKIRDKWSANNALVIVITHQKYRFSFFFSDGFYELYEEIKLRLREKGIIAEVEELEYGNIKKETYEDTKDAKYE